LAAFVTAEIKIIEKTIEVKMDNNTLTITGDGLDYERDISVSENVSITDFSKTIDYQWYENYTCQGELDVTDLRDGMNNLTYVINTELADSLDYYDLYSSCYANLTLCGDYKIKNQQLDSQTSSCNSLRTSCETRLAKTTTLLMTTNSTKNECHENNEDMKGQRLLMILVVIVCILITFFVYKKYKQPFGKRGQNSPVQDFRGLDSR
jgi:hypothetical protein